MLCLEQDGISKTASVGVVVSATTTMTKTTKTELGGGGGGISDGGGGSVCSSVNDSLVAQNVLV